MRKALRYFLAAATAPDSVAQVICIALVALVALVSFSTHAETANTTTANPATLAPKPKGPVFETTIGKAVAAPTDKRGFVTPKILGSSALALPHMVMGGMGLPVRMAARLYPCVSTSRPPAAIETAKGGFLATRKGVKTMTTTTGRPAPTPTTTTAQLFADCVNHASMAAWHSKRGNIPQAMRRARLHLAALNQLHKLQAVKEGQA